MSEWHGSLVPRKESRSLIRQWKKDIAHVGVQSYLICSTPRSGSTLLCDLLGQSGIAGHPDEYFDIRRWIDLDIAARIGADDDRAFFAAARRAATSDNGVCGFKIHWHQRMVLHEKILCSPCLKELGHGLDRLNLYDSLNLGFEDLSFVWIRRRNKVAQGISLYRAVQSGHWSSQTQTAAPVEIAYNEQAIDKHVRRTGAQDAAWEDFFSTHGIHPFIVWYEDLAEDPNGQTEKLLQFFGRDRPNKSALVSRLYKQAREESKAWEMRYRQSQARTAPTG
jgi:LPS sulfotransferase NodH